ncbi:MAG: hypothetical protein V7746_24420 [Halioglobus sp.]
MDLSRTLTLTLALWSFSQATLGSGVCDVQRAELGDITVARYTDQLHQKALSEARAAAQKGQLRTAYDGYHTILGGTELGLASVAARCGRADSYREALKERKRLGLIMVREQMSPADSAALSLLIESLNWQAAEEQFGLYFDASDTTESSTERDYQGVRYEIDSAAKRLATHPGQTYQEENNPAGRGRFEIETDFLDNTPSLLRQWLKTAHQFQQRLLDQERALVDTLLKSNDPASLILSNGTTPGVLLNTAQRWELLIQAHDTTQDAQLKKLAEQQADRFAQRAEKSTSAIYSMANGHEMAALELYQFAGREDKAQQITDRATESAQEQMEKLADQYESFRKDLPSTEEQAESKREADSLADELGL